MDRRTQALQMCFQVSSALLFYLIPSPVFDLLLPPPHEDAIAPVL